jgi:hypothetical protein
MVKKKVNEVNHRLKPLQDQIKKFKTEFEKTQTAYKAKVRLNRIHLRKIILCTRFCSSGNFSIK